MCRAGRRECNAARALSRASSAPRELEWLESRFVAGLESPGWGFSCAFTSMLQRVLCCSRGTKSECDKACPLTPISGCRLGDGARSLTSLLLSPHLQHRHALAHSYRSPAPHDRPQPRPPPQPVHLGLARPRSRDGTSPASSCVEALVRPHTSPTSRAGSERDPQGPAAPRPRGASPPRPPRLVLPHTSTRTAPSSHLARARHDRRRRCRTARGRPRARRHARPVPPAHARPAVGARRPSRRRRSGPGHRPAHAAAAAPRARGQGPERRDAQL